MLGMTTTSDASTTGMKEIAEALGGGIREGSLIMVEGEAKTGKSVICQYITYGILRSKQTSVAYFTKEYTPESLVKQMESISLDISHEVETDRFRICPLYEGDVITNSKEFLQQLLNNIARLPKRFQLIIVDAVTPLITRVDPVAKVDFVEVCKEMGKQDRSLALVIDRHIYEGRSLIRVFEMSDYYLQLRSHDAMLEPGQIDDRVIKVLNVSKIAGAERLSQGGVRFEIKPRVGIQILPFVKVKI